MSHDKRTTLLNAAKSVGPETYVSIKAGDLIEALEGNPQVEATTPTTPPPPGKDDNKK